MGGAHECFGVSMREDEITEKSFISLMWSVGIDR